MDMFPTNKVAIEVADELIKQNNEQHGTQPSCIVSNISQDQPEINEWLHKFAFVWSDGLESELRKTDEIVLKGDSQSVKQKHLENFSMANFLQDSCTNVKDEPADTNVKLENQYLAK